ncbi:MBOAT family O-acyltransferase [Salegentibacter sp. T436]|uniref:MBOAT family O-acyltransferase n=1 Tax=Salegentibacter sp. T436 TaxID=1729720 RepID=UPI00094A8EB9|nr:MBOAT family O-acyltransferase [Salegentibacter sp. T436]APS38794.1 acyltransferase [Salegentibacter sp. T436]
MLFNSISYLLFSPLVFTIYWLLKKKLNIQNLFILIASYFFYACWDYRFLVLIIFSTLVDFFVGIQLNKQKTPGKRRYLLAISIFTNLSLLGFFKYYNFFIDSWVEFTSIIGLNINFNTLNIILPVGISFYTFQTLSYTIDIYKQRIKPTKDLIAFSAFVSFFPQLVAGPIERASSLLPQFKKMRNFNFIQARSGIELIIWGLFQKIVIADNCATYVNTIFTNYENLNSLSLILGAVYFAFQIYGDFAGYSNIAIGSARLLGFDLMQNFNYPYFSKNLGEFWRRWHISLSTWFRDYVFIPLGGSRLSRNKTIRNISIVFLISGLWHGANWTFIFWGAIHALFYIPLLFVKKNTHHSRSSISAHFKDFLKISGTFITICLAWIFFRSPTINTSFDYLKRMFTNMNFQLQYLTIERYNIEMMILIILFVGIEWFSQQKEQPIYGKYRLLKTTSILFFILVFGVYSEHSDFIYFQF